RGAYLGELLDDQLEQYGRDGQVVRRSPGRTERLADRLERRRVLIVAVHVAQQAAQPIERGRVDAAVLVEAVLGSGAELLEAPAGLCHTDDRHVEMTALQHGLERGKDLLVREVARRAEEYEGVRMGVAHPELPLLRRLFEMATELVAHGREQLVPEVRLATRAEALVESRGEDRHRHCLVDGGPDRPPSLAGVRHPALEALERRVLDERRGRQVEEPGSDDASAAPHLSDVRQIEVVLVVLGVAQRRRLGVDRMLVLADIGGAQDAQTLGVGSHDSVLDSVVDHLDEVTAAVRAAVQIPALGGRAVGLAPWSAGDGAGAGSKLREDRIEVLHDARFAADHQAISALAPPYATAGPDVDIVDALPRKLLCAADVVDVIGVAAVDEDVAGAKLGGELGDGRVHGSGRDHQPDGPW